MATAIQNVHMDANTTLKVSAEDQNVKNTNYVGAGLTVGWTYAMSGAISDSQNCVLYADTVFPPARAVLAKAKLRLTVSSITKAALSKFAVVPKRLTPPLFVPSQVTWMHRQAGLAWASPGGDTDMLGVPVDMLTSSPGIIEWDITDIYQSWLDGTYNGGVLLTADAAPDTGGVYQGTMYAHSSFTAYDADKPQFVLEWQSGPEVESVSPLGTRATPAIIEDTVRPVLQGVYDSTQGKAIETSHYVVEDEYGAIVWDSEDIPYMVEPLEMLTYNQRMVENMEGFKYSPYGAKAELASGYSGNYSYRVYNSDERTYIKTYPELPCSVGDEYRFSVWLKTDLASATLDMTATLAFGQDRPGDNTKTYTNKTEQWTNLVVEATVQEGEAGKKKLYAYISSILVGFDDGLYWDNASLLWLNPSANVRVPAGCLRYGKKYSWKWRAQDEDGDWSEWTEPQWFICRRVSEPPPDDLATSDHLYAVTLGGKILALEHGTLNIDEPIEWHWVSSPLPAQEVNLGRMTAMQLAHVLIDLPEDSTLQIYHSITLKGDDWQLIKELCGPLHDHIEQINVPPNYDRKYFRAHFHRLKLSGAGSCRVLALEPIPKDAGVR